MAIIVVLGDPRWKACYLQGSDPEFKDEYDLNNEMIHGNYYAQRLGPGITKQMADQALVRLEVDQQGFDFMDRLLLETIIDKFGGGPVGLDTLAAAIGEEKDTIEDVIEPYLLQQGFLNRTPRGRVATHQAYTHLNRTPGTKNDSGPLFT